MIFDNVRPVNNEFIINLPNPRLIHGELTIIGTRFQLAIYELPNPSDPDYKLINAYIVCDLNPKSGEFIVNSVRSTQPLSVSESPITWE